ncbi:hypothetical protein BDFB_006664 [Asbolus verrucosus]|uniref:Uncharacterized protein n=1 Tax=Asbolus verrucosus TaxID=1661398 RepID=A0A482WC12_ASBVE|nr:hypothetical protein BDFB_006664 [Asbolus verrucosus]
MTNNNTIAITNQEKYNILAEHLREIHRKNSNNDTNEHKQIEKKAEKLINDKHQIDKTFLKQNYTTVQEIRIVKL